MVGVRAVVGHGISEKEYLFIDGNYLKEELRDRAKKYFNGDKIDLDYKRLRENFEKVFYYDCIPQQKSEESDNDYNSRVKEEVEFLNYLRGLEGFHVYEGTLIDKTRKKPRRQKRIDVMIAVHMLRHTIRRNMDKTTLLAGDLDFEPVIQALVEEGMWVDLWYSKKSTSKELVYAADGKRELSINYLWQNTTESFKKKYPMPIGVSQPLIEHDESNLIKSGKTRDGYDAFCYELSDEYFLIAFGCNSNKDYFTQVRYVNLNVLESYIEEVYSRGIKWDDV